MTIEVSLRHRLGEFLLDASFRAGKGITALFGPSGSGKTTIVNAVAGLLRPDRGRIVVDGETLLDTDARVFVSARHRRTGYVFQDARLFPHLTVRQNLLFGARRSGASAAAHGFDEIVALLGLELLLNRKPRNLSGGEKNRVALARALLAAPRVLLLDEPLAALDARRKAEIIPYFERLRDSVQLPMIYVTHSADEVSRLADDLIVLRNGRIAASGSVFDLFSDPAVSPLVPVHGAVFPAIVQEHRSDGLTALAFDGGVILVPHLERPLKTKLRVRLAAEDIILAREVPHAISANNVFAVRVAAGHTETKTHADVGLGCGGVKFVARITRASFDRLRLKEGETLYAIVKSVAVDPQTGPVANGTD